MKISQHGTGNIPERKGIFNLRTTLRNGLWNACEKLTPKQHRVMVRTMLVVFTILVAVSIADIFRNGTKLSEPGHISPLEISEPGNTPIDTVLLKTIEHDTK